MKASEAATTPTAITSLDDTTHEYVKEVPLESRDLVVDAGEVGDTIKLNENDADVHAAMANTLPRFAIIQSPVNNLYLHLDAENPNVPEAVRYFGDYSFGLDTRFEVVPATAGTGLVHIRCLQNNKYWVATTTSNYFFAAMASKPEENQSSRDCTLFQPVFVHSNNNSVLRLRHVHTGIFVKFFHGAGHLYGTLAIVTGDEQFDMFTFIDWESVVMLPDIIRIKNVNNGMHLRASGGQGFMDFRSKANNSSSFDYEVYPSRNGGIRLKSTQYGTYWTAMDDSEFVLLKQASTTVHDINTVFLPTILDGKRFLIRSLKKDLFCKIHSPPGTDRVLVARGSNPDSWHTMEIEEPVVSRTINNVRYHLTAARIYGEKDVVLLTGEVENRTQDPIKRAVNLMHSGNRTSTWTASVLSALTIKATMSCGIPTVVNGSIELSSEFRGTYQWGDTLNSKTDEGSAFTSTVPPMSRVKVSLISTHGSYDIPFSYTQRDVLIDGTTKVYEKNDGLFFGHNGYNHRYETAPV